LGKSTAAYGVDLFMAAIAYWILQKKIIVSQKEESILRKQVGDDWKGALPHFSTLSRLRQRSQTNGQPYQFR